MKPLHISRNAEITYHSMREKPVEVWVCGCNNAAVALVDHPWLDTAFEAAL